MAHARCAPQCGWESSSLKLYRYLAGLASLEPRSRAKLHEKGHEVIQAAPSYWRQHDQRAKVSNKALSGAEIVVDVANSPSFEDNAALKFFETSGPQSARCRDRRQSTVPRRAVHRRDRSPSGVRLLPRQAGAGEPDQGCEDSLHDPRATQFFEFVGGIIDSCSDGQIARTVARAVSAGRVGRCRCALADVTLSAPVNGVVELAGPERLSLDEFARRYFAVTKDARRVAATSTLAISAQSWTIALSRRAKTPARLRALRGWLVRLRK